MIKKLTTEAQLAQTIQIGSYAFNVPITAELEKDLGTYLKHTTNWGVMDGEQLTSQILVFPFQVNLFGQQVKMAGIGNVATYPEYRGQGGIRRLFSAIFDELRENGTVLSYLAPFSQPFYRKFGYEVIFSEVESKVNRKDIPQLPIEKAGQMKRVSLKEIKWQQVLKKLYAETLAKDNGSVIRENWWWDRYFELSDKLEYAVCFDAQDEPVGYISYEMKPNEMQIKEVCYTNAFAVRKIATYISSHSGTFDNFYFNHPGFHQVRLLFPDTRVVEQTLNEGMMVKIVSFEKFIAAYTFKMSEKQKFILKIEDEFSPWNQGTWQLTITEGKGEAVRLTKEVREADFSGTIQKWTQVFLGHSSLGTHCFLGTIEVNKKDNIEKLSNLLPTSQLGLYDFF